MIVLKIVNQYLFFTWLVHHHVFNHFCNFYTHQNHIAALAINKRNERILSFLQNLTYRLIVESFNINHRQNKKVHSTLLIMIRLFNST